MSDELPPDDAGLERLLREQAPGPPPWGDTAQWEWLLRQDEDALEKRVWPLVSRLLADKDDVIRDRALWFTMTWRNHDATLPRLLELGKQYAALYADQVVDGTRLRESLQHALANRCLKRGSPAFPVLLGLLDGKPPSPTTGAVIGSEDPKKAALLAAAMGTSSQESAWIEDATAAIAFYHRDELIPFLSKLSQRPNREALAARAERSVERDDIKLKKILQKEGLPSPTRPAPTKDELRRALGL